MSKRSQTSKRCVVEEYTDNLMIQALIPHAMPRAHDGTESETTMMYRILLSEKRYILDEMGNDRDRCQHLDVTGQRLQALQGESREDIPPAQENLRYHRCQACRDWREGVRP